MKEVYIIKPLSITQDSRLSYAEQDYICLIGQLSQADGVCSASNGWFSRYFNTTKQRASEIVGTLASKKIISVELEREGKRIISRTITICDRGIKEALIGVSRKSLGGYQGKGVEGIKDLPKEEKKIENKYLYTLRDNSLWELPEEKLLEYQTTFAGVDLHRELLKAAQWLNDNPAKRKTASGMPRFLSGWLSRVKPEQTSPPTAPAVNPEDAPAARRIREQARQKFLRVAK